MRSGAAIVPVVLLRSGAHHDQVIAPCYPEVTYDPQAPRDAEVRRVVGVLIGILEEVIRTHPDQWHVLDPVWVGRNAPPA
jgi:lauroyl/myristoyl acyltransferase